MALVTVWAEMIPGKPAATAAPAVFKKVRLSGFASLLFMAAVILSRIVHPESVQAITRRHQDVLASIQHVADGARGRSGHQSGMPEYLAAGGVKGDYVRPVTRKEQLTRGG